MTLKFDLDPTVPRVAIIAVLLFLEALLIPLYTVLLMDRLPTLIELSLFLVGATLQLITYLMSFLGYKKDKIGEEA